MVFEETANQYICAREQLMGSTREHCPTSGHDDSNIFLTQISLISKALKLEQVLYSLLQITPTFLSALSYTSISFL